MSRPLDGITVVEVSQSVAGPYAGMLLADLGARVVKVEHPERGDDSRRWYPPRWGPESVSFLAFNRGKESVALDLKSPRGREALGRLARRADVFLQNYRFGALERLGFGYEALARENPRLVYCNITAFGTRGPLREQPGYDPLMQAVGGLMSVTGEEGRPPVRVGVSIVDMGTGLWCALGVLAALYERRATGRGTRVDASLFETTLAWAMLPLMSCLATGRAPRRGGSGMPQIAPYQAFAAADGYVMIAAGNDAIWRRLADALGAPELADDPRFRTNPQRVEHREALEARLTVLLAARPAAEWERLLGDAGVPCGRIRDMADVAGHPQTEALGLLQALPHPAIADFRTVAFPLRFDGDRPAPRRAPPALGADTANVLAELGMEDRKESS